MSEASSLVRADTAATRLRIVRTAEGLFASRSIDGVSLQEVGRAAGQRNRNAVQYHFGDKLGLIARAVSWLTDDGLFVANLDLNNIKFSDGCPANRVIAREFRLAGLDYDGRKKLLRCSGHTRLRLPVRYLGADDRAGPNYTKQPAVDSYYDRPASTAIAGR